MNKASKTTSAIIAAFALPPLMSMNAKKEESKNIPLNTYRVQVYTVHEHAPTY